MNLGLTYRYRRIYGTAFEMFNAALALAQQLDSRFEEGHIRLNLGEMFADTGRARRALSELESARDLLRSANSPLANHAEQALEAISHYVATHGDADIIG